jgi:MFS family permease
MTGPLWVAFAPISSTIWQAYFLSGVSETAIDLLVIGPLIVEIFASMPLGALVDRVGWKAVTGAGAVIGGVVGVIRAFSPNMTWLLISQFILGVSFACMFVSVAKLSAEWFPRKEGAFAQGIGLMCGNAGNMAGLVLTPILISYFGSLTPLPSLQSTLLWYGIAAAVAAVLFFALAREAPPKPPEVVEEIERVPLRQALSRIGRTGDYWLLTAGFFVGFGIYISLTDYIERMAWTNIPLLEEWLQLYVALYYPNYFFVFVNSEQSIGGFASGLIILAGLVGTVVITRISDRVGRRKPFLILAVFVCTPMLYLMGTTSGIILFIAVAVFGFFLLALEPLVFQTMVELKAIGPAIAGLGLGLMLTVGHVGSSVIPLVFGDFQTSSGSYLIANNFYNFVTFPNYFATILANPLYYYFTLAPPLIQLPGTFYFATLFLVILAAATVVAIAFLRSK